MFDNLPGSYLKNGNNRPTLVSTIVGELFTFDEEPPVPVQKYIYIITVPVHVPVLTTPGWKQAVN